MTRDLFGHAPVQATYRRPRAGDAPEERIAAPDAWQPTSRAKVFLFGQGRSFTRPELLRSSGFYGAEKAYPEHEILVVFDTSSPRPYTYLIQVPRNHPARLDARGRPDPARQPFWRHGEIIHVHGGRAPP
ncbi:hypothetical protein [Achromobacter sp. Bel]|uniref:hypothetical protein n=1 Tax=Achromobacter sp. Bel TaxID=2727415 RepID=UPI00145F35F1|nr:hypothetical protein [Achromobacter sp. Bel]NMK45538.1 hypothetical protein [Achromobacter sp. Bel]